MWDVYVIQSINHNRYYIGYSHDAIFRLSYHNAGRNKSTRPYLPYRLVLVEHYDNKLSAMAREREIKKMKGGVMFKKLISISA